MTGKYVTAVYAKKHPSTTVSETGRQPKPNQPRNRKERDECPDSRNAFLKYWGKSWDL